MLTLFLLLAAAAAPRPPAAPVFPSSAARTYLEALAPRTGADGEPLPPLTAIPAAALEARAQLDAVARDGSAADRALAHFVLGQGAVYLDQPEVARAELMAAMDEPNLRDAAAATLIPLLDKHNDLAGLLDAAAHSGLAGLDGDPNAAAADPFYPAIAAPAARAAARLERWPEALRWSEKLPASAAVLWLRAQAFAATGGARQAAELERTLEYHDPASPEAALAASTWNAALAAFPDLAPDWQLVAARAQAWSAAGRARDAAADWRNAIALAPPASHDALTASLLRLEIGAGDRNAAADLQPLLASTQRAQGLELEVELARRSDDVGAEQRALDALRAGFPADAWYARALHEAGDQALLDNDPAGIMRDFDALVAAFPDSAYAAPSAWQSAWAAYRAGDDDAPQRIESFLSRYPNAGDAVDALYWRGAWAASHHDAALARACFDAAVARFPESYFGLLAASTRKGLLAAPTPLPAFLQPFVAAPSAPATIPGPALPADAAQRAELFQSAWLLDPAAVLFTEDLQSRPVGSASLPAARALAALDARRNDWHGGIVAMQHAVPNALRLPRNRLEVADWERLYPRPWPAEIATLAARHDLDVEFVYGLIRQESGFDPASVSPAQARGLMQLELATARAHTTGLPAAWKAWLAGAPLSTPDLLVPGLNLALGTAELGTLKARFGQPWFVAAAYDAGPGRVEAWRAAYPTADAAAFIESIPFTETRNYVQAVLRNQAMYKSLYSADRNFAGAAGFRPVTR